MTVALSVAQTTGSHQTRLSSLAAPPRKKPYWQVLLVWFLAIVIVGWLLAYLSILDHSSDTLLEQQFRAFVWVSSGPLAFVLGVLWRFNHRTLPRLHRVWEYSSMCRRCGHIFREIAP
jgi:hypothetical protein